MTRTLKTIDGNEAAAYIAYHLSEVIAIYPITPSSNMGELADQWAAWKQPNIWGTVPMVVEMQSEGGAAGAVHGALQAGSLTSTFTASQGLLLMIPNMYKIAGELTPAVFHIAARSVAAQALSIFGDHSDVMAARSTGWGLLSSGSVQEVMDLALVAHAASLEARVPFLHFFDGFRTSHEVSKVEQLSVEDIRALIDDETVRAHRMRAMTPDRPVLRGTAQNPDVFFQARESVNPFYAEAPGIVQNAMDRFAKQVGRAYHLFDYVGAPDAERILIMMGSGAETAHETIDAELAAGEKVGLVKVRLYRPFSVEHLLQSIPETVRKIAVLDRTKEPGASGEPLYLDVVNAFYESWKGDRPSIVGGRYGLSSKEFSPAMVKGILDELKKDVPKNHFTIGINDDLTHTSLDYDPNFSTEDPATVRAVFYGLGADGTVGANKNSIKIIGEETDNYAQGFFVYDSKKSGSMTISHLRFGPNPIRSTYLISQANFIACHQSTFIDKMDVLKTAQKGATFLLNTSIPVNEVWDSLPRQVQETIIAKQLKFYIVDGYQVAEETGMGRRINTILQACFFSISGVLPPEEAIAEIKKAIKKTYGKRGQAVIDKNYAAVDMALDYLKKVPVPAQASSQFERAPAVSPLAPEFVQNVTAKIIGGDGDLLPVSALPNDGTYPTGTARWEKRNIALEIPVWDEELCIQCGKCVFVCPHATIRAKIFEPDLILNAPETFKSVPARWKEYTDKQYNLQVAPEDCTGCTLCVQVCPVKDKTNVSRKAINMEAQPPLLEAERENWDFFLTLPEADREALSLGIVKDVQLLEPLFEFSGACAGCGETPYVKLLTQLYGDRALIANATGCSSIYGGNLPTTPYTVNQDGRGPTWSNSLFEDNAEFGLGMRLTIDKQLEYASELVKRLEGVIGPDLTNDLLTADQSTEEGLAAQRVRVVALKNKLEGRPDPISKDLYGLADVLVEKSVWILGGDGWAYDIGYGGLDHVLASGRNVNILVMDTEVYSNTGGQMSKATPRGAVAKFAASGKPLPKKDLGMLAMTYGHVYVARVAMGSSDIQTVRAFREAESYPGPSLIIAYTHCIAHGYDMANGLEQQALAVKTGYWPLYRYDPRRAEEGLNPLKLDSRKPSMPLQRYIYNETRYTMLVHSQPEEAQKLLVLAQEDVEKTWAMHEQLAAPWTVKNKENGE